MRVAAGSDSNQGPKTIIVVKDWLSLFVKDFQALANRLRVVIFSNKKGSVAPIAETFAVWWTVHRMINLTTLGAAHSARKPFYDNVITCFQADDSVETDVFLLKLFGQRFCLPQSARKAIEDKSMPSDFIGSQPFEDHLDGDAIWDELSVIDVMLGQLSQVGFRIDFCPKNEAR